MIKKKALFLTTLIVLSLVPVISVLAATHRNGPKWVRSTGYNNLYYVGEAYTRLGRGPSRISYYRSGVHLGTAQAVVIADPNGPLEDYKTVTVWDTLNPWAPKTTYNYFI